MDIGAGITFGSGVGITKQPVIYLVGSLAGSGVNVQATSIAVGTARRALAAAGYGTDKAIFGYGSAPANPFVASITNLVSNTGVVATDTTGVGTGRYGLAAASYGT
jgi:hypothetical protein